MNTIATIRARIRRELRVIERRAFKRPADATKAAQHLEALASIDEITEERAAA